MPDIGVLRNSARIKQAVREFFISRDFLEVDTPILSPFLIPESCLEVFKTELVNPGKDSQALYLIPSPELWMKRMAVEFSCSLFQITKSFRNYESRGKYHNPEFTQMELYVAYKDYEWMMDLVEEMVERIAIDLHGTTRVTVGDKSIDFKRPWKRYTMLGVIREFTGIDISEMDEAGLRATAAKLGVETDPSMGKGKLIDEIFGDLAGDASY